MLVGTLVYPPGLCGLACFLSRLVGSPVWNRTLDILDSLAIRALAATLGWHDRFTYIS